MCVCVSSCLSGEIKSQLLLPSGIDSSKVYCRVARLLDVDPDDITLFLDGKVLSTPLLTGDYVLHYLCRDPLDTLRHELTELGYHRGCWIALRLDGIPCMCLIQSSAVGDCAKYIGVQVGQVQESVCSLYEWSRAHKEKFNSVGYPFHIFKRRNYRILFGVVRRGRQG